MDSFANFFSSFVFRCLILEFDYWRAYWKLLEAGVGPFFFFFVFFFGGHGDDNDDD